MGGREGGMRVKGVRPCKDKGGPCDTLGRGFPFRPLPHLPLQGPVTCRPLSQSEGVRQSEA